MSVLCFVRSLLQSVMCQQGNVHHGKSTNLSKRLEGTGRGRRLYAEDISLHPFFHFLLKNRFVAVWQCALRERRKLSRRCQAHSMQGGATWNDYGYMPISYVMDFFLEVDSLSVHFPHNMGKTACPTLKCDL